MAQPILVIGPSGTGKSTSIESLNYKETFIIKVTDKPMPFPGSKKKYIPCTQENPLGNMHVLKKPSAVDRYSELKNWISKIDTNRQDIKNIVIDDYQYLMVDEFVDRCTEKGYDKFSEMSKNMWDLLNRIQMCRQDLNIILLCHNSVDNEGLSSMQCMGKLVKEKLSPEGKFTMVLHTYVNDGRYKFLTQFRTIGGINFQAKSPKGMFEEDFIDNDMGFVINKMNQYYDCDIEM